MNTLHTPTRPKCQSRMQIIDWLTSWLFCGFFGLAGIGFLQHAYWPSAALALLMALCLAPELRALVLPNRNARKVSPLYTATGGVLAVSLTGLVAEWERDRQQAAFEQRRDEILASAERARAEQYMDVLNELVSTYRFIETPELDRIAEVTRQAMEEERRRIDEIQRTWLDAADEQHTVE